MGQLNGLDEYLDRKYHLSIFDHAHSSQEPWELHLHGHHIITSRILRNETYDVHLENSGRESGILPKTEIKLLYPADLGEAVRPLMKIDEQVKGLKLEPIRSPKKRYHIKNKSLFPLMHDKRVVFFTLLEGEIIRGVLTGFSRYEITANLKGGIPITIMRHSIYNLIDKKGRCYLKSFQETHRDWEKSPLSVSY
ncbi:MAG: hypothetical protein SV375_17480 [Thermodesulfobacteriota bacterium]|nr:hypothetical protein [Thermodesulfobacteriota bacterium]